MAHDQPKSTLCLAALEAAQRCIIPEFSPRQFNRDETSCIQIEHYEGMAVSLSILGKHDESIEMYNRCLRIFMDLK